jgi:hypothetical protein
MPMPMTPLSSGRNNAVDVDDVLMPSTPLAYPQVAWRRLASFRVVDSSVSRFFRLVRFPAAPQREDAGQRTECARRRDYVKFAAYSLYRQERGL